MEVNWKIRDQIEKILDSNIKEIPYEGKEVDKQEIVESICELIRNLK